MNKADSPKIKKTKNKIRVDFERTPLLERLRARFLNTYTLKKILWYLFRLLLLIGVSYIILFPFFSKIAASFMSAADFSDVTVLLIPKHPTLSTYKAILVENGYFSSLLQSFLLSGVCGVLQTFVCCMVGYGFAKFKFKGSNILFFLVIFTMVVPHPTLKLSLFIKFRYFDVGIPGFGIMKLLGTLGLTNTTSLNLLNSNWPLWLLSATGLAYKNGLFIFLMRQFFKGIPDELEESAYLDGSGVFRTFLFIIIPISVTMMITVFMFAFCWQWTDTFYSGLFFTTSKNHLLPSIVNKVPPSLNDAVKTSGGTLYQSAITNTSGLLIIFPLIILYLFGQKYIVQGIERSGITG